MHFAAWSSTHAWTWCGTEEHTEPAGYGAARTAMAASGAGNTVRSVVIHKDAMDPLGESTVERRVRCRECLGHTDPRGDMGGGTCLTGHCTMRLNNNASP